MSVEIANIANLETPKSSQGVFELPCGHVGSDGMLHTEVALRELTGAEEDLLASKQMSAFKKYNELLVRCTVRIGTVTDRGQISAVVKNLPIGDRLFLLFAIRRVSIGDEYTFNEACPNTACAKNERYTVKLSELDIKKMPDPKKRIYDATLPSGATARFRISTGVDEERAMGTESKVEDAALSKGILMRLELLNGAPPELQAVKDMKWRDRAALREEWNKVEGGVDTEVEMNCPACGHFFKKDIEVTPSFFFPSVTSTA
jgi:hypothetical protein